MPPRPKKEPVESGRFYEIRDQVSGNRRGPYKLTEDIVFPEMTPRLMRQYNAEEDLTKKMHVLLGGHFEDVEALYDERPIEEWNAFLRDLRAHYFGQGAEDIPGGSNGS